MLKNKAHKHCPSHFLRLSSVVGAIGPRAAVVPEVLALDDPAGLHALVAGGPLDEDGIT